MHKRTLISENHPAGRWPANVAHDGSAEVLAEFPVSTQNGYRVNPSTQSGSAFHNNTGAGERGFNDTGSAARFFYCAKASKADRDEGCEGMPSVACGTMEDDNYDIKTGSGNSRDTQRRNHHPTVKPTALMRYLCRLVTPPKGIVLDPFMGSGSTGKAAILEDCCFIGIEIDPYYCEIARCRLEQELAQGRLDLTG
jgi:site-specific DNA-methyltransferase (adenine-specific)